MPLVKGKSKKAFHENLKTELHAGKPKEQALAIAYDVQRRNRKKRAHGGHVEHPGESEGAPKDMMAKGGKPKLGSGKRFEQLEHHMEHEKHPPSDPAAVAAAIGRKKYGEAKMAKMAEAGKKRHQHAEGGLIEDEEMIPELHEHERDEEHEEAPDHMLEHEEDEYEDRDHYAEGGFISREEREHSDADDMEMMHGHEHEGHEEIDPTEMLHRPEADDEEELHEAHSEPHNPMHHYMSEEDEEDNAPKSLADAVRLKMRKHMARGGMVHDDEILKENYSEGGNDEDDLSYEALRKPLYSEEDALEESTNRSDGQHGHADEDEEDMGMIKKIRSKMRVR